MVSICRRRRLSSQACTICAPVHAIAARARRSAFTPRAVAPIKLLFYSNFLPPDGKTMSDAPFPASHQRIRWIAHCVRAMALIAMAVVVGFQAMFWTNRGLVERTARSDWGLDCPLQFDAVARAWGLVVNLPQTLLTLFALLCLWRLFGAYLRGEVFTDGATRHLRRLGQSVTTMALVMPLTFTVTILALTLGNPPGQRILSVHLASEHYIMLLLGLVLIAMAMVMREAQRMAQENAEFV